MIKGDARVAWQMFGAYSMTLSTIRNDYSGPGTEEVEICALPCSRGPPGLVGRRQMEIDDYKVP
jgi:hypothetical protein